MRGLHILRVVVISVLRINICDREAFTQDGIHSLFVRFLYALDGGYDLG